MCICNVAKCASVQSHVQCFNQPLFPGLQKSYLQSSLDHYKWLVEYCDKHQETAEQVFSDELPLCKEMVELLPFRLDTTAQQ